MENLLIQLGENLEKPTSLVVIGSTVCMGLGQPNRMTMDIDVWRPGSKFDLGALKRACAVANITFNPQGYDEPSHVYIQLVDPGIVQIGQFSSTSLLLTAGNLEVRLPPVENIIASKMVRAEAQDFDDCIFLMKKCRISFNQVFSVICSIQDTHAQEIAQENTKFLQTLVGLNNTSF